jgi:calcium channel MID1
MRLTRPTPAQSRLLRSAIATYILLAAAPFTQSPSAYASEVPAASAIDAINQPVLQAPPAVVPQLSDDVVRSDGNDGYTPDFDYFDRSLLGRQEPQAPTVNELNINGKKELDIDPGKTAYFVLKKGQKRLVRTDEAALEALEARGPVIASGNLLDDTRATADAGEDHGLDDTDGQLEKRQSGNRVFLSANTCRQPNPPPPNGTESPTNNNPQLVMYVSTSSKNQKPGPDSTQGLVTPPTGVLFEKGFASVDLISNSDVYIGISAPMLEDGWFGSWHFELAASNNGFYHSYNGTNPFLFMIDTDSDSALFISYSLDEPNGTNDTEKWIQNNPFKMYAFEEEAITNVTGLENSMCAMQYYQQSTNVSMETSITTKFGSNLPKSQFHLQGLKAGKTYNGFLTVQGGQNALQLPGNTTVRGGGMVFQQFDFQTKSGKYFQAQQKMLAIY